jgi:hypothetical protein
MTAERLDLPLPEQDFGLGTQRTQETWESPAILSSSPRWKID